MTVTKISFQGEYGAYSDAAARKYIDEYNLVILALEHPSQLAVLKNNKN